MRCTPARGAPAPLRASFILSVLVGGCVGAIGDRGGDDRPAGVPPSGGQPADRPGQPPLPGAAPGAPGPMTGPTPPSPSAEPVPGRLRRLTRSQLEATLRDLLGDGAALGATEEDSTRDGLASIGATYGSLSPRGVEQLDGGVQALLGPIFADPARRSALLGCAPRGVDDVDCVRRFVTAFGRRAWRRPLSPVEVERYTALALSAAKTLGDVNQGLLHATSGLLESPHFVYRVEIGAPDPASNGRYRYSGWEMASRLGYTLWNSTPDEALLDAAQAGRLDSPAGVREQAARLLASPRAKAGVTAFARELVELDDLADAPKNDKRMTPTLRAAMAAEVELLFARLLDPGVDALEIFDGTTTFANAELAALYGLPAPGGAAQGLTAVRLPAAGPRSGLLGTGAILSLFSEQDKTSPTARGVFVREKLLCQPMPQPPDGVNTTLPAGNLPLRAKLEMHRVPGCRECHDLFDPIGFGLESFDWVGALRDKDAGVAIDSSGNVDDFRFKDARELNTHLRGMPEVQRCLLQNLFRTSAGHLETDQDRATLEEWNDLFARSGRKLTAFLTEVVASKGFRTVSAAP
jgi:hypothetical protein